MSKNKTNNGQTVNSSLKGGLGNGTNPLSAITVFSQEAAVKPQKNQSGAGAKSAGTAASDKPVETARDKWRRLTKDVASATSMRQKISESKSLLDSPEDIKTFANIVRDLDALAVYKLSLDVTLEGEPLHSSERDAEEAWFACSWEEQEEKLAQWSEAQELLSAFNFWKSQEQNAFAQDSLCNVVARFDRPLRHVQAFGGLVKFLNEAVDEGLLNKILRPDPDRGRDYGVFVPNVDGRGEVLYLPKKGVRLVLAGWTFVKDAEARARATQASLDELRREETRGITPVKISNGLKGSMFVQLGPTQAVLLEFNSRSGWPVVKVKGSVGMKPEQIPDDETQWDDKLHQPKGSGKWAWIQKGIEEWKARRVALRRTERQEKNERTLPITKLATENFPVWSDDGLTRMLKGEPGVIAVWMERFKWSKERDAEKKEALFGVAIERRPDGTFFLLEVVSHHAFPYKKLVGAQLPLEVDTAIPAVRLKEISTRDRLAYAGLKMVEILMKLRLSREMLNPEDEDELTEQKAAVEGSETAP